MERASYISDFDQEFYLLRGVSGADLDEVIDAGVPKTLQPNSTLFHQGDPATMFFMVNKGRLKLSMVNEQGSEVIFRYIIAGELTAAVAVLKGKNYPLTAVSVDRSELIGWDKSTLLRLMAKFPPIAFNILNIVLERLDELQNRYMELSTEQVKQRIARTLLRLMQRAGVKIPEGIQINIPLSRQNIADYSGTTVYTVSRTLSVWEKKGWIRSGRGKVVITNPHALVQFAETAE
jgi:CRP-like cAMP-binding protein